jgi:hypothetical protein
VRWPWKRDRGTDHGDDDMSDERLAAAEREAAHVRDRADAVRPFLEARARRNYWGEAAAAIARRE